LVEPLTCMCEAPQQNATVAWPLPLLPVLKPEASACHAVGGHTVAEVICMIEGQEQAFHRRLERVRQLALVNGLVLPAGWWQAPGDSTTEAPWIRCCRQFAAAEEEATSPPQLLPALLVAAVESAAPRGPDCGAAAKRKKPHCDRQPRLKPSPRLAALFPATVDSDDGEAEF
jgi:hypothetical protein